MDPMTIGALIGLGKSFLIDKPKEKKQRELAAKTIELSPWTGMQANPIQEADPFGEVLKYGATGAAMEQGNMQAALDNEYKKAQIDYLNRSQSGMPWDLQMTGVQNQNMLNRGAPTFNWASQRGI